MSSYGKSRAHEDGRHPDDRELQMLLDRLLRSDVGGGREAIIDYLADHLDTKVERIGNEVRIGWLAIKLNNLGHVLSASSRVVEKGPKRIAVRFESNSNDGDT